MNQKILGEADADFTRLQKELHAELLVGAPVQRLHASTMYPAIPTICIA